MPPCLMPVNELISICKKYGKLVLVDGAHAPGQVPLNLESLGCDFFAGWKDITLQIFNDVILTCYQYKPPFICERKSP